MCKNYLILYIFLLTMINLHTANAHHELEDQNIVNGEEIIKHIVPAVTGLISRVNLIGGQ